VIYISRFASFSIKMTETIGLIKKYNFIKICLVSQAE